MEGPISDNLIRSAQPAILAAAQRLFGTHGYHATSIADLLDAVGLTKGALYHHFRSKEQIGLALLAQAHKHWQQHVAAAVLAESQPEQRLALLVRNCAAPAEPVRSDIQLLATLAAELTEQDGSLWHAARDLLQTILQLYVEVIAGAQARGCLPTDLASQTLAQALVSWMLGAELVKKLQPVPPHAGWMSLAAQKLLR